MLWQKVCRALVVFLFGSALAVFAQSGGVPGVVPFNGALLDPSGQPLSGIQSVNFALYQEQTGGTPLWGETQNVTADAQGRYSVLLGSSESAGLPQQFFSSTEARWLGVQVNQPGQPEQPRVLLVSVPYALKASDADTLGGLPASAFLLNTNQVTQRVEQSGGIIAQPPGGFTANIAGTGTQGNLAVWTDNAGTLGNAAFFQSGNNIGLGTTSPATLLHVANDSTYTIDSTAALTVSNGTTPAMRMMFGYDSNLGKAYIQATQEGVDVQPLLFNPLGGAVGLGTSSPQATMHVAQDSAYTSDAAAGLLVSNRTTPAKRMMFGYDANIDASYVQSTQSGVNVKPFVMNPAGGNVGINKTTATQPLDVNGNIASSATVSANLFSGSGASLTTLNASNISSGTLAAARGGTGLASCAMNQTLSWNGSAWACATATAGTVTSVSASSPLSTSGTASAPIVNLTGTVTIANGGTGAVTAAAALTNLGAASLAANTFSGTQTIGTGAAANKGLIVKGAASQTADLQEWQNSAGTVFGSMNSAGIFNITGTSTSATTGVLFGKNTDASNAASVGVWAQDNAANGTGLWAVANSTGNGDAWGVYGESDAVSADSATGARGVYGWASDTNAQTLMLPNYGVYGETENSYGYGVYSFGNAYVHGNLGVMGSITAGTKDFKIDHPQDPANKYLLHASVESSEAMNVYSGNVILNGNGSATVQLPDWFEALNQDFRYQLTAIGGPGPNLYIAQEIQGNSFQIAGGTPGLKVSWQVEGIRHDPYAVANPLQVEQDKPDSEKGLYLHPELYGQPPSQGVGYASSHAGRSGNKGKQ